MPGRYLAHMTGYAKSTHWEDSANKLFLHQVGFTGPPHDFDAAPSDFLRIAPRSVGVHGRMLHSPVYAHELTQRSDNFHLLEEFVHCMANNGADVAGQVGTNWVHCNGTNAADIRAFCDRLSDTYETVFHMAGMTLVEAARSLGVEKIALNSVYYWPDWRDGIAGFLSSADLDVQWAGNFVDQGFYETQHEVNDRHWCFPEALAVESVVRTAESAPDAECIVINGMPNFRRADGLAERALHHIEAMEAAVGLPVIASDTSLYWAIFQTLGVQPTHAPGALLGSLAGARS